MSSDLTRKYAERNSKCKISLDIWKLNNRKRDSETYQIFVSEGFYFDFGRNLLQVLRFSPIFCAIFWFPIGPFRYHFVHGMECLVTFAFPRPYLSLSTLPGVMHGLDFLEKVKALGSKVLCFPSSCRKIEHGEHGRFLTISGLLPNGVTF